MSGRLFKRAAKLTLAKPLQTVRGGRFGAFFQQQNGVEIGGDDASAGLRFTFRIEKDLESPPNPAEIVIYNLSERSRGEFQAKPLHVRLDVGYDGETERLFVGDMHYCEQRRTSVDWETRLTVHDGGRAFRFATVNRSFKPGVTAKTAITEVIGAMGLEVPGLLDAIPNIGAQFAGGLTMTGPANRELSRLLDPYGASWSIQDGRMQILRDQDVRTDQAILVNQDAGLVGPPEYGPPPEKGKPPVLKFKMLLYPGLTPGGLVQLDTRSVKGTFKIRKIAHTGDTHGPDWHSEVEATAR